ncbi:MAG TPA: hypothetical protein VK808_00045 [Bacteroidia bacterium]|jgi:hypothetical protein|nr:hypothetical protein [Bacteroidia bacterium]
MLNSVKKVLLISTILYSVNAYSQDSIKECELPLCTIQNNDFKAILDSFLINENKCYYYSDKLVIWIALYKKSGKHHNQNYIHIEAVPDTNLAFGISNVGYCMYKNHIVLFFSDTCSGIYTIGMNKKKFKYSESHLPGMLDGPETRWGYYYNIRKNKFKLAGKGNCDNDWGKTSR